ncbi:AzlD domain-containing protein [Undibacterium rugosum]|uniref:AzlD domain-containing protein n=1 Tax=Undibacterium rugosum TaxID=2762291 RepID=UPI001B81B934|nr:AzlD domain-containing protein [Undibacterium rugosum]MBR7778607.1 AzlD domain-containing protein [Undibacterium rugosum]
MRDLDVWLTIALLVLATFIARSGFWLVGSRVQLPKRVQDGLRYAPACALAALIFPDLLMLQGQLAISWNQPRLVAGVLATAFFLVRRNMLHTILFGMAVFTYLRLGQ